MITRALILCSCLSSTCTWGGFFQINTDADTMMGVNSMGGLTILEQAQSSILKHGAQLDIRGNDALLFQRVSTDSFGNQHLHFNVAYQGIEVEKAQIIAHFNQTEISSISGYQQLLSAPFKDKINTHLNQGKTQLTADKVLAFINPQQHKVLSNKPMIVQTQPYVIWQVRLLINGIPTVYRISDNNPPSVLSKTIDIQY